VWGSRVQAPIRAASSKGIWSAVHGLIGHDSAAADRKSCHCTHFQSITSSGAGSTEASAGSQSTADVVIWNRSDRQEVGRYTFEKGSLHTYYNRSGSASIRPERDPSRFCFSPEGDSFLAGCYGGILRATSGGQELARFGE